MDEGMDVVVLFHQPLDGVGDFQFAAPGGFHLANSFVYVLIEHVNAHQSEIAARVLAVFPPIV